MAQKFSYSTIKEVIGNLGEVELTSKIDSDGDIWSIDWNKTIYSFEENALIASELNDSLTDKFLST